MDFFGKIIMNDLSTLAFKIDILSSLLTKISMEINIGFYNKIKSNYNGHDGHYDHYDHYDRHQREYWNNITRHLSHETISLIQKEVKESVNKEIAGLKRKIDSAIKSGSGKNC